MKKNLFKENIKWKKIGLLVKPKKNHWWMKSHIMNPTPVIYKKKYIKLYFAGRDKHNRSQTGFFILDPNQNFKVLKISKNPIIKLGRLGTTILVLSPYQQQNELRTKK